MKVTKKINPVRKGKCLIQNTVSRRKEKIPNTTHLKENRISNGIKFNKDGLIPVIIQDYKNNQVLMVAYMNRKAFELTLKTNKVHFFSRSRNKLWLKGETSGNFQRVKSIYFDCDSDALLIKVSQRGGACHEGYRTCFFRKLTPKDTLKVVEKKVFDEKKVYKIQ